MQARAFIYNEEPNFATIATSFRAISNEVSRITTHVPAVNNEKLLSKAGSTDVYHDHDAAGRCINPARDNVNTTRHDVNTTRRDVNTTGHDVNTTGHEGIQLDGTLHRN